MASTFQMSPEISQMLATGGAAPNVPTQPQTGWGKFNQMAADPKIQGIGTLLAGGLQQMGRYPGKYGTDALMSYLLKGAQSGALGKVLGGGQPGQPTPTPQAQPVQQPTQGRMVPETTAMTQSPLSRVSALGKAPAMSGIEKPVDPIGSAEANAGTPALNNVPAALAGGGVAPSVQNLNEGIDPISLMALGANNGLDFLGNAIKSGQGYQDLLHKQRMAEGTLDVNRQNATSAQTTAESGVLRDRAALMNAYTNIGKENREADMHPYKIESEQALTQERLASASKQRIETDLTYIQEKAKAEAIGKGAGIAFENETYANSPYGQMPLDKEFKTYMGLAGNTFGDLFRTIGVKGTEELIKTWATAKSRERSAGALAKGAENAANAANKYSDMYMNQLEKANDTDRKMILDIYKNTYVPNPDPRMRASETFMNQGKMPRTAVHESTIAAAQSRMAERIAAKEAFITHIHGGRSGAPVETDNRRRPVAESSSDLSAYIPLIKQKFPNAKTVTADKVEGGYLFYSIDGKQMKAPLVK